MEWTLLQSVGTECEFDLCQGYTRQTLTPGRTLVEPLHQGSLPESFYGDLKFVLLINWMTGVPVGCLSLTKILTYPGSNPSTQESAWHVVVGIYTYCDPQEL